MARSLAVLVVGATGKQGGSVVRRLLERGHRVRALTRKPDSPAAGALATAGAEIAPGDVDDRASLGRAVAGVDAVFTVVTPFEKGTDAETRGGINLADAAKAAGTFLVYSSVANADRHTGIPHFDSKYAVEQHIRSIGVDAAIIAPVYFMENLFYGLPQLRKGTYGSALSPGRPLLQIAVSDIGATAVSVLEDRARHAGKRYDLAGDELTGEQLIAVLTKVTGRPFQYFQVPMEMIRAGMGEDGVRMNQWFESTGYSADRPALRRDFPEVPWLTFEAWARQQDWQTLLAG